jgi:hypothetical protein
MLDTEKFIIEIEGKPSIWDITSSDYQNRDKQINDWGDICKTMCEDWESLDAERRTQFGK